MEKKSELPFDIVDAFTGAVETMQWGPRKLTKSAIIALKEEDDPNEFSERLVLMMAPKIRTCVLSREIKNLSACLKLRGARAHGVRRRNLSQIRAETELSLEMYSALWEHSLKGIPALYRAYTKTAPKLRIQRSELFLLSEIFKDLPEASDLIIVGRMELGGNEKVCASTYRALVERGLNPLLIVADSDSLDRSLYPDLRIVSLNEIRSKVGIGGSFGVRKNSELLLKVIRAINPQRIFIGLSSAGTTLTISGEMPPSIKIFYMMYSMPTSAAGRTDGFFLFLPWLERYVTSFISDSKQMVSVILDNGIPSNKVFHVHVPVEPMTPSSNTDRQVVVWASRLDEEKRPDLLLEIAKSAPDLTFRVYGVPVLGGDGILSQIENVDNIDYRGGYQRFCDLDLADCSVFLYTSRYDGRPNVVLEAMSAGLVPVASDVGDLPNVLTQDRGILVRGEAIDYVAAIRRLFSESERRSAMKEQCIRYVSEMHSVKQFKLDINAVVENGS